MAKESIWLKFKIVTCTSCENIRIYQASKARKPKLEAFESSRALESIQFNT
jgi:hypothetical protein